MARFTNILNLFLLVIAFHYSTVAYSQELLQIKHSCSFDGDEEDTEYYIDDPSNEANQIVVKVMKANVLSQNFIIKSANCKNALATSEGDRRYILYSTSFLESFKKDANTQWAAYSVLAHEIGHHLNYHNLAETDLKKRRLQEIQADKFAGGVLFRLGATLEQAQAGIKTFSLENETSTHPPKSARLEAVANGWKQAAEMTPAAPINITNDLPQNPSFAGEPEMVFVEGGTFTMGCKEGRDKGCQDNEKPAHTVTLSDFYIGKYEVTFEEYDAFCEATNREKPYDVGWGRGKQPVINVNWEDATAYSEWLSKKTGKKYRLPTEAEWEYAARGGNKSKNYLYAGNNNIGDVAWYVKNAKDKTQPVGQKKANELGIYDMSGNVWEWCSDRSGDYSSSTQTNPKGPSIGQYRVFRGGSWDYYDFGCRVSTRLFFNTDSKGNIFGFRLARY